MSSLDHYFASDSSESWFHERMTDHAAPWCGQSPQARLLGVPVALALYELQGQRVPSSVQVRRIK